MSYQKELLRILEIFKLNWKAFLGIHVAVNVFSLLVLTPVFTTVLGWLVLASGQTALTDEDILLFALSPVGFPVVLLSAALYTMAVVFELAAMITASRQIASGQSVSFLRLVRFMLGKFWSLFRLAVQMIGRTLLISLPFILAGGLIFSLLLSEYDINFYLAARPEVFWWASGCILACLMGMAGVLLRVFSGWVLALPMVLINNVTPARALGLSRAASESMRLPIILILLTLFLVNAGMLALLSFLTQLAIDGTVSISGNSLQVLAYMLGSVMIVSLTATVAIAFFGNSVLALVINALFGRLVKTADAGHPGRDLAADQPDDRRTISTRQLAGLAIIISVVTGFTVYATMQRLDLEKHTSVIAHRGASADAPENTLAALEIAISEGADWVEIDVQETREGEVVVIHDRDLKKVGGSALRVFDAPLSDLQGVDIGSWMDSSFSDQRVPTLQQVLALCKDRVGIVIELKYYGQETGLEERVVSLVETASMQDQVTVMSLSYPGIQKISSLRPDWKVGLLSSVAMGDITRLDVDFFAINARFASRSFIKRAHRQEREVMVWTVNDPVSMSAMISKGVDGIITDLPGLAVKVREERAELEVHERMMIQLASYFGKQPLRPEQ
jgi:glycerophosphoryl diester phosphodiesterase